MQRVFECVDMSSGERVAVKVIDKTRFGPTERDVRASLADVTTEVECMQARKTHPTIKRLR